MAAMSGGSSPSVADLRQRIAASFSTLGDYLWKLPSFLDDQRRREQEVLDGYLPEGWQEDEPERRLRLHSLRRQHEFGKLDHDFPVFMASSSFVHLVSLLEYHALLLCRTIERATGIGLDDYRGRHRGIAVLLRYADAALVGRLDPQRVRFAHQLVVLRNCLVHADGVLDEFRQERDVRAIVDHRLCYRPDWTGGLPRGGFDAAYEPDIVATPLGDRLHVPMLFTHWAASVAATFLLSICDAAMAVSREQRGGDRI